MCTDAGCSFSRSDTSLMDGSLLIRRAREGCRDAQDVLFQECRGRLLAQVDRRLSPILRAHVEPNDILQVALMRAFQSMDQFRGTTRECFVGWVAGIARNTIRDQVGYLRRHRRDVCRTVPLDGEAEIASDGQGSTVARLVEGERARRLQQALATLSIVQKEVLLLRVIQELSFRAIGERIGRSPDACRMILARTQKALARRVRGSDCRGLRAIRELASPCRGAVDAGGRSSASAHPEIGPPDEDSPSLAQKNVA